ncbi:hypothetical protein, partial [Scytonema sp. NUACC21]
TLNVGFRSSTQPTFYVIPLLDSMTNKFAASWSFLCQKAEAVETNVYDHQNSPPIHVSSRE